MDSILVIVMVVAGEIGGDGGGVDSDYGVSDDKVGSDDGGGDNGGSEFGNAEGGNDIGGLEEGSVVKVVEMVEWYQQTAAFRRSCLFTIAPVYAPVYAFSHFKN